ncbi:carbohydrate kinase family protein [Candidatus Omnitrophota bacterium]
MSNIDVVGLGALNIDCLYKVEHILNDGEAVVEETKLSPGGSAANTIYGLAKLGVNTGFTGVVGDDDEGKMTLEDFQKVGVDTSQIGIKSRAETGSVVCLSDRLGKRSLYVMPRANNLLTIDDLDLTYINQAKMLHISAFVDDRQFDVLLELVGKLDLSVKISFSPGALYSSKGLNALTPILTRTHALFINESEIQQLTKEDVATGAESCLKQGCHMVAVTLGKGINHKTVTATSYIRDSNYEYVIEPGNKNIISALDTTGAGDAFATGFLYGLLNGKGLEECGRLGDITSRFSITKMGAREGLPTLVQLSQRYQELYHRKL